MSSPAAASLEALSLAELRELVGALISEVSELRAENTALQSRAESQQASLAALRAENQALRDEVARLKGLPSRPPVSRLSGMEKATSGPGLGGGGKRLRRQARPQHGHGRGGGQGRAPAGVAL